VTLLLLLTSSGVQHYASATAGSSSGLQASLYLSTKSAQSAVPATSSAAAVFESRASDLAAVAITAVSSLVADLTHATDKAAEQIDVTTDLVATLRNQTVKPSAAVPAVSSFAPLPESRASDLAAVLIPVVTEMFVRIPPRSLGGVAGSAAGRSSTGSATGGARGAAGTATSAPGR